MSLSKSREVRAQVWEQVWRQVFWQLMAGLEAGQLAGQGSGPVADLDLAHEEINEIPNFCET